MTTINCSQCTEFSSVALTLALWCPTVITAFKKTRRNDYKPDERFQNLCRGSAMEFFLLVMQRLCERSALHRLFSQHCYVQRQRPLDKLETTS